MWKSIVETVSDAFKMRKDYICVAMVRMLNITCSYTCIMYTFVHDASGK